MNTKFWDDSDTCFVSEPLVGKNKDKGEVWFTSSHSHDIGSTFYNWYYMIPFAP